MRERTFTMADMVFSGVVNKVSAITIFLAWCTISTSAVNVNHAGFVSSRLMEEESECVVVAHTCAGTVCGTMRTTYNGASYASFRGIPYARPPLGELRFLAPEPVEPWDGYFNATIEGPICPQRDSGYGPMLKLNSMGEDCLHVNVHVPAAALPKSGSVCSNDMCRHVIVMIYGGGFNAGSGDSDVHGPEYIMDHDVIFITFNYRLGPFGFLSLNSSSVPGNTGLRDMVAALKWVQRNARTFGGDPRRVTLMGHSAGAVSAHILSLSKATEGLFTKLILMSGVSNSGFFSTSLSYVEYLRSSFLTILGINSTDVNETIDQLNKLSYETILDANSKILEALGFVSFSPVVETQFDGMTRIVDEDLNLLLNTGRGNQYPMLLGFTNKECETSRPGLEANDIIAKIKQNFTAILPPRLLFYASTQVQATASQQMISRYFNGTLTLDKYIPACTDSFYIYPALKVAQTRAATGGSPVFMYQFSYNSDVTPVKQALGVKYTGAAHLDDLSYVLRVNSILQNTTLNLSDKTVKEKMTSIVVNFARCSNPTTCETKGDSWAAVASPLQYQDISGAAYAMSDLTAEQQSMFQLFDSFYEA